MLTSTTRFLLANFFTASHRVLGRVQVGSSGLIGVLNGPNNSSIEVTQVSLAQLQENLDAWDKPLADEVLAEIEAVHLRYTNPAP